MTKLLYVVNIPRFFVTHRMPLALAARAAGYDVHVATATENTPADIQTIKEAGFPFHPLPLSQHGTKLLSEVGTLRALYRLYRSLQPDIVHHVTIKPVIYGGIAARAAGVPAVVNMLTGLGYVFVDPGRKAALIRALAKPAYRVALAGDQTRLIFQNPDDRDTFVQHRLIDRARTVVIAGSGVDVSEFTPQPQPSGTPLVLFAGRLLWQKGIGAFVEAARALRGRAGSAPARFVIVGYPEPSSPYAVPPDTLDDWAAEGVIEWWGKRTDMPNIFAQSSIVCLPSTYGEGVPKVLIEAAACARPLVATDVSGCREIARHEQNALLVPPDDVPALTTALARLIDDAALRERLGAQGRIIAEREFALELVVRQTFAVYDALLSRSTAQDGVQSG